MRQLTNIPDISFDSQALLEDFYMAKKYLATTENTTRRQICVTSSSMFPNSLTFGSGSLEAVASQICPGTNLDTLDYLSIIATWDIKQINEIFVGRYTEKVAREIESYLNSVGKRATRIRFMEMVAKSCLSYHVDLDTYRLHVPLQTNQDAFFVVAGECQQMTFIGKLYQLQTNVKHTAINGSKDQTRIHLVIDTM